MQDPGIYYNVPMPEYLAIKAVSAGVLRTLIDRCPAAAWHESPYNPRRVIESSALADVGTIAHAILLEGSRDCICAIDPRDHPAEKTQSIPDGWTNKSIRAARDAARAAGKIPVLLSQMAEIDALVTAAECFIEECAEFEPYVWQMMQPEGGDSEVVMIWREGATLCKLRADRIAKDHGIILDYKTTDMSVEPNAWARRALDFFGAAWYRRGVKAVTGIEPDYIFLAGERAPPYLHALLGVTPEDLALGKAMAAWALAKWQYCESHGAFPGYPPRTVFAEAPPWVRSQWEARGELLP